MSGHRVGKHGCSVATHSLSFFTGLEYVTSGASDVHKSSLSLGGKAYVWMYDVLLCGFTKSVA